jgi:hypothetical protein
MASIGVAPRVCKPRTPQTKGKIERSVGVIKYGFWPGVHFIDIDDLNEQASTWCNRINQRVQRTTRQVPLDRWVEENLTPLPKDYTWERFGTEERRVTWDGFISYDGVLYGLPSEPAVAGSLVLVRERSRELRVFSGGRLITTLSKRPQSQEIVYHPDQFRTVAPAAALKVATKPLGHQIAPPEVTRRPLAEYDQLFGLQTEVAG